MRPQHDDNRPPPICIGNRSNAGPCEGLYRRGIGGRQTVIHRRNSPTPSTATWHYPRPGSVVYLIFPALGRVGMTRLGTRLRLLTRFFLEPTVRGPAARERARRRPPPGPPPPAPPPR